MTQAALFDGGEWWHEAWRGMPEFVQNDVTAEKTIKVEYDDEAARSLLAERIEQKLTPNTTSAWYPESERNDYMSTRYVTGAPADPRYPVYIISKGRAESRLTSKALEKMRVPYHIVVEPQEFEEYAAVIAPEKILVLPFSNLGEGSIPARNWCWEDSIKRGAERHWILDDNIYRFCRLNHNKKFFAGTGAIFQAAEDFVDRYENVALAGFQYWYFAPHRSKLDPFMLNTRVYSVLLIKNDLPLRWRGRYNEDTDLSLRVLKAGWVTVLFYAFLAKKVETLTMSGGNMDELYAGEGRRLMAESLRAQHPDVVKVTQKWGRSQHSVNYSPFRNNKLVMKAGLVVPDRPNEYGMSLEVTA